MNPSLHAQYALPTAIGGRLPAVRQQAANLAACSSPAMQFTTSRPAGGWFLEDLIDQVRTVQPPEFAVTSFAATSIRDQGVELSRVEWVRFVLWRATRVLNAGSR